MRTLDLDEVQYARLAASLRASGMPPIPAEFSVVPTAQLIPSSIIEDIEAFIGAFEAVTTRTTWRNQVLQTAPEIARIRRKEVCFFSAWDFHLPPGAPDNWQLIEFNDNGSGFMFAALFNECFHDIAQLQEERSIEHVQARADFARRLMHMVTLEAHAFFGENPQGLFFILDEADSLREGRFRQEHVLLRDLFHRSGFSSEIGAPEDLAWTNEELCYEGRPVGFIVNRSTDFFWQSAAFDAVKCAYIDGNVYVAPNPFTYATRSDKCLLENLSTPTRDEALGISAYERAVFDAHVPRTLVVTNENAAECADRKDKLVFKPAHGFAGKGVLDSSQVGSHRLRRLLRKGQVYVAQEKVAKSHFRVPRADQPQLWCDLRVWSYRGKRLLLAGRASVHPERLALNPPGGWLPTFVCYKGTV